jgi:hypothetical protein
VSEEKVGGRKVVVEDVEKRFEDRVEVEESDGM